VEDNLNYYSLTKIQTVEPRVSYSGFGWTPSGDFKTAADWDRYVADFAARVPTPVYVKVERQ
jgi:hypothetical protein